MIIVYYVRWREHLHPPTEVPRYSRTIGKHIGDANTWSVRLLCRLAQNNERTEGAKPLCDRREILLIDGPVMLHVLARPL